ncbi:hypothetical protein ACVWW4_002791 [Bradyrhizobium sp. LB7.1]
MTSISNSGVAEMEAVPKPKARNPSLDRARRSLMPTACSWCTIAL